MDRAKLPVAEIARLPAAKIYSECESYGPRMRAVNEMIGRVAATDLRRPGQHCLEGTVGARRGSRLGAAGCA